MQTENITVPSPCCDAVSQQVVSKGVQAGNIPNPPPSDVILRPFQQKAFEEIHSLIRAGIYRILLVAPTGAGKGTIATYMIRRAVARGRKVVFLVNRRELVKDMSRRLDRLGLDHGVIMADHWRARPWLPVQIASIDTLHRRKAIDAADLLFADEAHFCTSPMWQAVIDRYPGARLIGMTATPCRLAGDGLGTIYERIVLCPSVAELTADGYLVPARVYAPSLPDLSQVVDTAGDYNQKQLGSACDRPKLVGDIVTHWCRLAENRPTVVFAVNVDHSEHIAGKFREAGFAWKHVDADTPSDERDRAWEDLESGRLAGVSSVGIISFGWDCPRAACAVLARPTQSLALHLQQIGRILRPAPGKSDALILDHAGNVLVHGFPDDPREWTLEHGAGASKRASLDNPALSVRMCRQCWMAFRSRLDACPGCGWRYTKSAREIRQEQGELRELARKAAVERAVQEMGTDKRRAKFEEYERIGREKNYKPGWAVMRFRAVFGHFPPKAWKQDSQQEIAS